MFYCFQDDVIFEKGKGTKTSQGEIEECLCKKWNFLTLSEKLSFAWPAFFLFFCDEKS